MSVNVSLFSSKTAPYTSIVYIAVYVAGYYVNTDRSYYVVRANLHIIIVHAV